MRTARRSATNGCWNWKASCAANNELFSLAEQADRQELPDDLNVADEIALRQERLVSAEAERVADEYQAPGDGAGRVRSQAPGTG